MTQQKFETADNQIFHVEPLFYSIEHWSCWSFFFPPIGLLVTARFVLYNKFNLEVRMFISLNHMIYSHAIHLPFARDRESFPDEIDLYTSSSTDNIVS